MVPWRQSNSIVVVDIETSSLPALIKEIPHGADQAAEHPSSETRIRAGTHVVIASPCIGVVNASLGAHATREQHLNRACSDLLSHEHPGVHQHGVQRRLCVERLRLRRESLSHDLPQCRVPVERDQTLLRLVRAEHESMPVRLEGLRGGQLGTCAKPSRSIAWRSWSSSPA